MKLIAILFTLFFCIQASFAQGQGYQTINSYGGQKVAQNAIRLDSIVWREGSTIKNRQRFSYDSLHRVVKSVVEKNYNGNWSQDYAYSYVYDESGKLVRDTLYDGKFIGASSSYHYNGDTLVRKEKYNWSNWGSDDGDWNLDYKIYYNYDEEGRLAVELDSALNQSNNEWEPRNESHFVYADGSSAVMMKRDYRWNAQGEKYEFIYGELSYDENDRISRYQLFRLNIDGTVFENYVAYDFDMESFNTNSIFSTFDGGIPFNMANGKILGWEGYVGSEENNAWESSGYATCYYSEIDGLLSTTEELDSKLSLYPNPTKDKLTIEVENGFSQSDFQLCDSQGKVVMAGSLSENETISVEHLEKGFYFVRVANSQGGVSVQKFFKH